MKYILLFRGLNVGGHGAVKMPELAAMLASLGLLRVRTYIQSGNAAVECELPESELCVLVREGFAKRFGFACDVYALSGDELSRVVTGLPFTREEIANAVKASPDTEHLYVYFLPEPPSADTLLTLTAADASGDRVAVQERALYLLCAGSVRQSKLASRIARRLPTATARNWNTVLALAEMARG